MQAFLVLLSILALGNSARALEPSEFIAQVSGQSSFVRAQAAYDFCEESFNASPEVYQTRIQAMGQLWQTNPDAAYLALSTCQTIWTAKYLDPARLTKLQDRNRSTVGFLLAGADLLYSHLPEEIRLTLETLPSDPRLPLSPYEILSHLAASEKRMNETLHREMRSGAALLLSGTLATGLTARTIKGVKGLSQFVSGASQVGGKVVKHLLLVALVAVGVEAVADSGMWQVRRIELERDVERWAARLLAPGNTPLPVLLEQYYKSLERLGFFYTYDLYLAESGQTQGENAVQARCLDQVQNYFAGSRATLEPCPDAASAWITGAEFLSQKLPGSKDAALIAERLKAKAKRALWRYMEAEAYKRALPVCRPIPSPSMLFDPVYECRDESGNIII